MAGLFRKATVLNRAMQRAIGFVARHSGIRIGSGGQQHTSRGDLTMQRGFIERPRVFDDLRVSVEQGFQRTFIASCDGGSGFFDFRQAHEIIWSD